MTTVCSVDDHTTTTLAATVDVCAVNPTGIQGWVIRRPIHPIYRGVLVCLFLLSAFVSGRTMIWYWSEGPCVTDLKIFMTGVELIRNGQRSDTYKLKEQQIVQERLFPETRKTGYLPYNHLAYELLLYWPLARLPYRMALMGWGAINAGLLFLIGRLMWPITKALREYSRIPILIWMIGFYPVLFALGQGQDSIVTLLMLAFSLRLMEDKREYLSGFALGLMLFKIHLSVGIAFFVFLVPHKWRGLLGFATSAALTVGISIAMVGPNCLRDYVHILREQETATPWGFIARFMPNFRGMFEWGLIRWVDLGLLLLIIFLCSLATVATTWLVLRVQNTTTPAVIYAAAIPTVLLVSYHMHLQDLTLALLPMLVLIDTCVRGRLPSRWVRVLMLSIAGFYLFGAVGVLTYYLVVHAALLMIPLLLLWLVSIGNSIGGNLPADTTEFASASL